ncbi:MAG TPA: hypothetical protein VJZ76_23780, partial [Thermoanaerobaculia bacterium]|nr:hypothetical protein [Thermoanaerobaculia bacterium]
CALRPTSFCRGVQLTGADADDCVRQTAWSAVANTLTAGSAGDYTLSIACPVNVRRRAAKH